MPIICPPPLSEIPTDALPPVREEWDYTPLPKPIPVTEQRWPEGTRPLVTVRCITYNQEQFIRQAIDGFLMQETTFPVQILVHDDASTDGTAAIVREYAERYPELIVAVLQPENLYSKGRPLPTADLTFGRYIAFCEGDDYWTHPRKLQLQCTLLESDPGLVLTYHPVLVLDSEGNLRIGEECTKQPQGDIHLHDLARRGNYIHTPSVVMRNTRAQLPPEADKSPVGDFFWWMLALRHGQSVMLFNSMAVYRWGTGRWSIIPTAKRRTLTVTVYLAMMEYFHRIGDDDTSCILADRAYRECREHALLITHDDCAKWADIGPHSAVLVRQRITPAVAWARRWRWVPWRVRSVARTIMCWMFR